MKYFELTNTHRMFHDAMRTYAYVVEDVCQREVLPFFRNLYARAEQAHK